MHEKQRPALDGWGTVSLSLVCSAKGEAGEIFQNHPRPPSLRHSFCFSIQRAPVWGQAWCQGYLTLLYRHETDFPKTQRKENEKAPFISEAWWLRMWTSESLGFKFHLTSLQLANLGSEPQFAHGCYSPSICVLTQSAPQKRAAGSMGLNIRCFEAHHALEQSLANGDLGDQIQPAPCLYTATG